MVDSEIQRGTCGGVERPRQGRKEMNVPHQHTHAHESTHPPTTLFRLRLALGLTVLFVVIEAVAGIVGHSLALLSDAGHNLTDALALGLTFWTYMLASQPTSARRTYGFHRAGILAALLNTIVLVVLAIGIIIEAYFRWQRPEAVNSFLMISVAAVAMAVNLAIAFGLHGAAHHDVNVRASYLHVAGDAASALGVVIAGALMLVTGQVWLDSAVSVLIALFILWSSRGVLVETLNILLENTPSDIDARAVQKAMCAVPGVLDIHDLHLWSVSSTIRAASAHVLVKDQPVSQACRILSQVNEVLGEKFGIAHTSLQLETTACDPSDVFCHLHRHSSQTVHFHHH